MTIVPSGGSRHGRRERDRPRDVVLLAGAAFGAVLALVAAAIVWPSIGSLAYVAVVTIGSVVGAAIGALGLAIKRTG